MVSSEISIKNAGISTDRIKVGLEMLDIHGDLFFKISHVERMRPFFMSLVSDDNHWLFISSNGGMTAGRKNAQYALFPYYTDDKITESAESTGSKTIIRVEKDQKTMVWEPFSLRSEGTYRLQRNLYKAQMGNKIIFEEINDDLGLIFSYEWSFSAKYGFIRRAQIANHNDKVLRLSVIDGLQNILPYGVGSDLQSKSSNLADAYKRSELLTDSGLGIFALSAIITDKAEPSEALKANTVFALGIEARAFLLSSNQLQSFRLGSWPQTEKDVKAEKGAYLIVSEMSLSNGETKEWMLVANVNQSQTAIIGLHHEILTDPDLNLKILGDVDLGSERLASLVGAADGWQKTADLLHDSRHYSNVLFNIMRGGIFDDHYKVGRSDFIQYLRQTNSAVFGRNKDRLEQLDEHMNLVQFKRIVKEAEDRDLSRLATEYLPLKFSRRHGDPSRPWNSFSINLYDDTTGYKILDYEGNWRDLFQNWEALAYAYPFFIEGMISKFLNATTFDGYNPYRVTKNGFDWETIEVDNPWSYIGYWGDHQIIYLLKFLEFSHQHFPGLLPSLCNDQAYVYANVPYQIRSYEDILKNPKDTILFDEHQDREIREEMGILGTDAAFLRYHDHNLVYVSFIEKILATVLAKVSNFIPDAGIWLNTQRPEWNDANNALVGNGTSVVTLCYLRRFFGFLDQFLASNPFEISEVSSELNSFFHYVRTILHKHAVVLNEKNHASERRLLMDALGSTASQFRMKIYQDGFSGSKEKISIEEVRDFVRIGIQYFDQSIEKNKRSDGLYHGYNILSLHQNEAIISHLPEMLEGQVAALSSGKCPPEEGIEILESMRNSALYRPDQNSYLLYPNKQLHGFLAKNCIDDFLLQKYHLRDVVNLLVESSILEKDREGIVHFHGKFTNARFLKEALDQHEALSEKVKNALIELYEAVFDHKSFTGRSGTFYGYEGLGSIYWHMVSKLRLAVNELCRKAYADSGRSPVFLQLVDQYYEICKGLGIHKSPDLYGAFPTDPYSHTPLTKGAQQPGMTGQVKEDIICRWGELGVIVEYGMVRFEPFMLMKSEFIPEAGELKYYNMKGERSSIQIPAGALAFTYCQVPIIYTIAENSSISLHHSNGNVVQREGCKLTMEETHALFARSNMLEKLVVGIPTQQLLHN